MAPDSIIYDACHNDTQSDAVSALIWSAGLADVITTSEVWENDRNQHYLDKVFDYWASVGNDTIVAGTDDNSPYYVRTPGKAWNVITVGGSDYKDNEFWSDDSIWSNSGWINPNFGVEKPEVVAPATSIT